MNQSRNRAREKLVKIYSTPNEIEARMVQELLAEAGVESMINAEVPPSLFPLNLGTLATKDIFVIESAAAEASRILSELLEADAGPEPD